MSNKSIHQKLNISCFSNERGLSLDDKTKDSVDRNTGGQYICCTRSHNSVDNRGENLHF